MYFPPLMCVNLYSSSISFSVFKKIQVYFQQRNILIQLNIVYNCTVNKHPVVFAYLISFPRMLVTICRFLRPLVADVAVVAKCHLSALYTHEKGRLFAQLVDLLQFYEGFEINDHSGTQLGDDDVLQAHYSRFQAFQLIAFKQVPKVRTLLSNLISILWFGFL